MKRQLLDGDGQDGHDAKRTKAAAGNDTVPEEYLSIQSPQDIRDLLCFQQDGNSKAFHNIRIFRSFLQFAVSSSQAESASRQSAILLKWLNDEVTLVAASDESPLSMDIIQTWKYAVQIKHDRLIQAIPDTLATLISSVSTRLEFEESGLRLCRALLHPEIVKLLDHGLSSNTEKTANAAACLDLLTQVVAFGGGGCAWRVYAQRDVTLRRLDSYLSNPGSATTTTGTATQIRQYALQYTMANLRYQTKAAKIALLTQHGLARALFHDVHLDSPDIVIQLLEVVKQNVVMDDNVPRSAKGRLLGDYALGMILDLLKPRSLVHNDQTKLAGAAYQFLKLVCTSHRSGVLMQQSGWYPLQQSSSIDSGQAGLTEDLASRLMPRIQYNDKVPVRNTTLASLLQRLRPYANDQERDLAVSIFAAAPELVADYFLRKRHFSLDPRLSSTWIGYTAFILAVIQSPVSESELPSSHESQSPPPVAVALESIIPQPLSKHALTKSINQSKPLVRFVALRLLKASFTKLGRVLAFVHASRPQWMSWSSALVKSFSQRCPELVHVISAYQSCSQEQQFLKEAISSVLTLYYKYTPQLATREVFDVSISLMLLLQSAVLHDASYLAPHMDKVQLMHLLKIASLSSTMRWWHKPDAMFLSPFTSLLRLCTQDSWNQAAGMETLLQNLAHEQFVLQKRTQHSAFTALLTSMQNRNGWAPSPALWTYLDECMLRLVRRPIKYQGDVLELLQRRSSVTPHDEDEPVSLLIIVLTEQWPFLATRQGQKDLSNIAIWLDRYLSLSKSIGENLGVIRNCRSYLQESTTDRTIERLLRRSNDNTTENPISKYNQAPLQETHNTISVSSSPRSLLDLGAKEYPYDTCEPPKEGSSHGGLNRWLKDDLADAIEGGHIGTLIMCLCSQFAEIRKQALANLKLLMSKLKIGLTTEGESVQPNASRHSHGNQHQLYILVGELYETASGMLATESMPSYVASFAAHVVLVLHRPLHPIYAKINKFLLQKPSWNPRSLPSYWLDMVVTQSPTIDDRHTDELDWVLDTLFEGLCTSHDMDIYRRCGVFERVLALATSDILPRLLEDKILRLIHRAASIGGGRTLVTRNGVICWMEYKRRVKSPRHSMSYRIAAERFGKTSKDVVGNDWLVEHSL